MNYLRKYRNRYICKIELLSALDGSVFPISPPDGFDDDTNITAEYSGVYFTISSAQLSQKTKISNAGPMYIITLEFSFPNFPESNQFQLQFGRLAEIRLTLNTGDIILSRFGIYLQFPQFSKPLRGADFGGGFPHTPNCVIFDNFL